ncbi:MAG TPA: sigma-70 family RNA polymerase sigma factor [Ktedonobacterales bacterium]|nr:sigma-70 family RNA polymerase sigma factor [Ktedonobacterales bacterium]
MAVISPWQSAHPRWTGRVLSVLSILPLAIKRDTPAPTPTPTQAAGGAYNTFEEFIAGREADIFGYLWRLTGDEQTAYDLCQETLLRAWQQFGKIRHYEQPGAWLFRVATNLALNAIARRDTMRSHVTPLDESDQPSVEDAAGRIAHRDLIHTTLLQLSARERAALVLREVEGFSANSVRMLLSRARANFRQRYVHSDSEEAPE